MALELHCYAFPLCIADRDFGVGIGTSRPRGSRSAAPAIPRVPRISAKGMRLAFLTFLHDRAGILANPIIGLIYQAEHSAPKTPP